MNAYHNAKSVQNEIPWIYLLENERNKNRRFNGLNNNDTQGINKGNQANVTAKNVFDLLFTKFFAVDVLGSRRYDEQKPHRRCKFYFVCVM